MVKVLRSTFLVFLLLIMVSGCLGKRSRDPIIKNSQGGSGNSTGPLGSVDDDGIIQPTNGRQWGEIFMDPSISLDQQVALLVSSFMDPSFLGPIDGDSDAGISFWGGVRLNIPIGQGTSHVTSGDLALGIWDSLVGSPDPQGVPYPPIFMYIGNSNEGTARGSVSGSQASVIFEDRYGSIELRGQVQGQTFSGEILFVNKASFDNLSPPAQGRLGPFAVPTCGFFFCN